MYCLNHHLLKETKINFEEKKSPNPTHHIDFEFNFLGEFNVIMILYCYVSLMLDIFVTLLLYIR